MSWQKNSTDDALVINARIVSIHCSMCCVHLREKFYATYIIIDIVFPKQINVNKDVQKHKVTDANPELSSTTNVRVLWGRTFTYCVVDSSTCISVVVTFVARETNNTLLTS